MFEIAQPEGQLNSSAKPWEFDFSICDGIEEGRTIWAVCTGLCFLLGLPAAVAILWEMFKAHRKGTPLTANSFFVLNLTVMDTIFLIFIPPGLLNHFLLKNPVWEAIWNGIYAVNLSGRPLLMACSCLDCYLAVVHPIIYYKRKSLIPRVVMAAIVWAFTVAIGISYTAYYWLLYTMLPVVPFLITIITIGICDSFIFYTLVKSDSGRNNLHPQKQRAMQTLINSLVMTIFSYLPPVLLIVIGGFLVSTHESLICCVGIPMTITSSLGSVIMPILHLHNQGKLSCFRSGCFRKS